jgi:hypothetical protein
VIVADRDFGGANVDRHAFPERQTLSFFKEKGVLPVGDRIDSRYVQRVSGSKLPVVEVDRTTKSIGGRTLEFPEPRGQQEKIKSGREAVQRVVEAPKRETTKGETSKGETTKGRSAKIEKTTDGRTTKSR